MGKGDIRRFRENVILVAFFCGVETGGAGAGLAV